MKGDFSRRTFDPEKYFSRVLMQQGRVHLDADWNEQAAIQLHLLRTLVQDIVGPHGGPADSFMIRSARRSFRIMPGHYYVGGILCELDHPVLYAKQPNLPLVPGMNDDGVYLAYLDVSERHVSYLEDEQGDEPGIREVALGGADTATRAKVVWQVKLEAVSQPHEGAGHPPCSSAKLGDRVKYGPLSRRLAGIRRISVAAREPGLPEGVGEDAQRHRLSLRRSLRWRREPALPRGDPRRRRGGRCDIQMVAGQRFGGLSHPLDRRQGGGSRAPGSRRPVRPQGGGLGRDHGRRPGPGGPG